jgi:hypothetical protein
MGFFDKLRQASQKLDVLWHEWRYRTYMSKERKNQIEAQRSGFDLERRSSGMSAL